MTYHSPSKEGVIDLNATGYITVHAYTSYAQLPLKDVAVAITAIDGTAIAMRLTNRSGKIDPVAIPVPARSDSISPGLSKTPFTAVNLYARLKGYEQIEIENLQVFADTTTNQNLEMIPLSELPESWGEKEIFLTPRQNL